MYGWGNIILQIATLLSLLNFFLFKDFVTCIFIYLFILLLSFFVCVCGGGNLSSPTKEQTHALCLESVQLTTWPTEKSLVTCILKGNIQFILKTAS